jgi:hypothetical protein
MFVTKARAERAFQWLQSIMENVEGGQPASLSYNK